MQQPQPRNIKPIRNAVNHSFGAVSNVAKVVELVTELGILELEALIEERKYELAQERLARLTQPEADI